MSVSLHRLRAWLGHADAPAQPPGPPDPLGYWNALQLSAGTLEMLRLVTDRYGDVVHMKLLGSDYYLLNHPRDIEQALVGHAAAMGRDEYTDALARALGQGLLTSDGELWKRQRKLMAQAFTPKRIRSYGAAMVAVADRSFHPRDGEILNLHSEMGRLTMEVVAAVLFGTAIGPGDVRLVAASLEILNRYFANSPELLLMLPGWVPTPLNRKVNAAVADLDALIYRIIAARRASLAARGETQHDASLGLSAEGGVAETSSTPGTTSFRLLPLDENPGARRRAGFHHGLLAAQPRAGEGSDDGPSDLLATLIAAVDDGGSSMSDQQLRDEAMTLFLAGHETTALALAHTLYLLATHPEIERRLCAELDSVLAGRPPTAEDAKQLLYTERVIKESMRLYPPAWTTGREVLADVEIAGYHIPKGAQLLMSQWLVHRDHRFFPDPEAFDPDRWIPERAKALPRYAYFPFGGGPRVCIGSHFAVLEATLLLALLMQRAHFELLPGQTLAFDPAVTLRQKGPGLRARVHLRG